MTGAREGRESLENLNHSLKQSAEIRVKVGQVADNVARCSREQSRGVDQCAKAISQMEHATQATAASAEEGAAAAEQLSAQAEHIKQVVHELTGLVGGGIN